MSQSATGLKGKGQIDLRIDASLINLSARNKPKRELSAPFIVQIQSLTLHLSLFHFS